MLAADAPWVRVLAVSQRGRALLRAARAQGTVTLLHAGERAPDSAYARLDAQSSLLYDLFCERAGEFARLRERVFCPSAE